MPSISFGADKGEIKWLAERFGQKVGLLSFGWWNEDFAKRIIMQWANHFELRDEITDVLFFSTNLQIDSLSMIPCDMFTRTVKRPISGIERPIWDKPLGDPWDDLLLRQYPVPE